MSVVNPQLGKHVSAVLLTVQNITTAGGVSDAVNGTDGFGNPAATAINVATLVTSTGALHTSGFAVSLGILDELELTASKVTENIRSVNRTRSHNVPLSLAYGFTVTEIMRPAAAACQLAGIWFGGNTKLVKLVFARARRRYTIYGTMTDYVEAYAHGKNVGRLTCRPANIGSTSVAIATAVDR